MLFSALAEPGPAISIPAGITIGLFASSVQSLGITIQRKSHVLNQEAPETEQRVEHRRPLWLLGFGIFITSNILGSVFQIASLPVVILAPLGAVSLLWNALFARLILGDIFSKFMVLGTLLIVAGAVLIARFGIVPEPTHSLEDLLALFARDAFVIYFSLLGATLFIVLAATHIFEWSLYRRIATEARSPSSSRSSSPIPLTPSHRLESETTERTPLLQGNGTPKPTPSISGSSIGPSSPFQKYRSQLNLIAISYASASGTLSGMCLIFAKSGVELLLLSIVGGKNQFWRWESWALVGGLVVFALLQLWYLHKSLVLADPTLVCPLAFCFYNISSIVNGLVYYDQLDLLSPLQRGLVVLGSIILLAGVWTVSIQTDDDEGVLKEGDWIPADEEGVAAAVAPADVVRVAERATGTLPPNAASDLPPVLPAPPPATSISSPEISPDREAFPNFPTAHRRVRSSHQHGHHQTLPPLTPTLGQILGSPESPTSKTIPSGLGFSIGISAASPGFFAGTRRRSELTSPALGRRAVSETYGGIADRRRTSTTSELDGGEEHEGLMAGGQDYEAGGGAKLVAEPDEMEATERRRGGWVWRLVPWASRRRSTTTAKASHGGGGGGSTSESS